MSAPVDISRVVYIPSRGLNLKRRVTGRVPTNLATISGVAFQASKVAFKAAERVLSCARRRTSPPRVMTCSLGRMVEAGGTRATKTLM
jgi:hypothetical protein